MTEYILLIKDHKNPQNYILRHAREVAYYDYSEAMNLLYLYNDNKNIIGIYNFDKIIGIYNYSSEYNNGNFDVIISASHRHDDEVVHLNSDKFNIVSNSKALHLYEDSINNKNEIACFNIRNIVGIKIKEA